MTGASRILLVDDHAVVCEGYRALLQQKSGLSVVAIAGTAREAWQAYKRHRPDLVIMDLTLPDHGGIEATRRLRAFDPSARILILTMHQSAAFAVQAFRAGARGFITKSSPPTLLLDAVASVLAGGTAVSPDINQALALAQLGEVRDASDRLTPREFEILQLLLAGQGTDQMAHSLGLSAKTIANTRSQIRAKLGVASDIGLVRLALEQGLLIPTRPL